MAVHQKVFNFIPVVFAAFLFLANPSFLRAAAPYPKSAIDISFDLSTYRDCAPGNNRCAPGSDNWAITWADNGHQYTSWGDGGGFGGTNSDGRVSFGFARIEGDKDNYSAYNVWGGKNSENRAQFGGKSYGLLSIDSKVYMWKCGTSSNNSAYDIQELYESTNRAASWNSTGVRYTPSSFSSSRGFFCPTFLQFGRGYEGARDEYVYTYAPEVQDDNWEVQKPGKISLLRVPENQVTNSSAYEYFAGLSSGQATWTTNVNERKPVFEDTQNGVMRTSVAYNAGLDRYFLVTQQVSRFGNGHIGIYDAPEPWGPWTTVLFRNAWDVGLQTGSKTVYWNFSNKWTSQDGKHFTLVYTGKSGDNWASVEGNFSTGSTNTPTSPPTETLTPTDTTKLGDADKDSDIDAVDQEKVLAVFGFFDTLPEDFDSNSQVDIYDYNILVSNFGK